MRGLIQCESLNHIKEDHENAFKEIRDVHADGHAAQNTLKGIRDRKRLPFVNCIVQLVSHLIHFRATLLSQISRPREGQSLVEKGQLPLAKQRTKERDVGT